MPTNDGQPARNRDWGAPAAALIPGLLSGVIVVIMSVSLAALIFSGPLAAFTAQGIALAINTAIIAGLAIALLSACRPVISMVDEDTAPVFALLAALVASLLPAGIAADKLYATALAAIVGTTLLTGCGLALLGAFRVGRFMQFLPHSVMGGYFAAVGWLLVAGGIKVAAPMGDTAFGIVGDPELWFRWLPALLLAFVLLGMRGRARSSRVLPITVLIGVAGFYALLATLDVSVADGMRRGLLLGPFADNGSRLLQPLAGVSIADVEWRAVLASGGTIASVFLLAVLSLLLSVSGLGFLTRAEPDMNRELRIAGLANIASGFGGGMTGLPSYSISSLAVETGGRGNRWVGVVAVIVCAAVFLFGLQLIAWAPRFVLSGILIYLGLGLLKDWLIDGRRKFALLEYLVIPIIWLVSIAVGFIEGIVVGLIAAVVLFVIKYSQTRVVRFVADGSQLMSNVDRISAAQERLLENGDRLLVLGLQGYLFFGTAGQVYECLRRRLDDPDAAKLGLLVLDFTQVTGLDASAGLNFQRMLQLAEQNEFEIIVAGLTPELRERLQLGGFGTDDTARLRFEPDLDRSLEVHERRVLGEDDGSETVGCFEQMSDFLDDTEIERLKTYMEAREVDAGEVLADQGDRSDELYFCETCAASAWIRTEAGGRHRVRHTTRGTVFGELGFYLQIPRTASVITDEAGVVYVLERRALLDMEERDPEVAAGLNRYMAILLSERLMFTTRTLRAFLM